MDPSLAALLGGAVGLALGAVSVVASRVSQRQLAADHVAAHAPEVPRGVGDVLSVLRSVGIVVDPDDRVVNTSPSAISYGLVRGDRLVHEAVADLVRRTRRDGEIRESELGLLRGPGGTGEVAMRVRVAPLGAHVLVLAEDHTHEKRVEEVRRDFVANVSHELKTPVGGISLLAEAIRDASDEPDTVVRFADRILVESTRLSRLVQEIVEFSRLQVADTLHAPDAVDICGVIQESVDHCRVSADARNIHLEVHCDCPRQNHVYGDASLLVTAVSNLITNAVNYSEPGTRVSIGAASVGDTVEISVRDQGSGIPAAEQTRIFERFYRVDAARSRATGGTGLGLAIVKHICQNHGGRVTVWSEEGHGSTFRIILPAAAQASTLSTLSTLSTAARATHTFLPDPTIPAAPAASTHSSRHGKAPTP